MRAEIICVGTELLLGNILNTNVKFLSEELAEIGIDVYYHTTVGDNFNRIAEVTKIALNRSDILIFTGGLGPTDDDCTKEAVCKVINRDLYLDNDTLNNIKCYFKNKTMVDSNSKQALIPTNSIILKNDIGTAPGLYIKEGRKTIIMLPGPPNELKLMFDKYVKPIISENSNFTITSRIIKTIGIGESLLEEKILDLIRNQKNPTIATYAKDGQVDIRITAKSNDTNTANIMLDKMQLELKDLIGDYIYSYEDESIEEVVFKMLSKNNLKIGFCESCTAGLATSMLANISGASKVLERSIITYSNLSKIEEVGVSSLTLEAHGAVSRETAIEMATGLLQKSPIDLSISITGIAGPNGGTDKKPIGLVYICLATKSGYKVERKVFHGNREKNRLMAAKSAFNMIRKYLIDLNK